MMEKRWNLMKIVLMGSLSSKEEDGNDNGSYLRHTHSILKKNERGGKERWEKWGSGIENGKVFSTMDIHTWRFTFKPNL